MTDCDTCMRSRKPVTHGQCCCAQAMANKQTLLALHEILADAAALGCADAPQAATLRARIAAAEAWTARASEFFGEPELCPNPKPKPGPNPNPEPGPKPGPEAAVAAPAVATDGATGAAAEPSGRGGGAAGGAAGPSVLGGGVGGPDTAAEGPGTAAGVAGGGAAPGAAAPRAPPLKQLADLAVRAEKPEALHLTITVSLSMTLHFAVGSAWYG